jgi:hypothetical protein
MEKRERKHYFENFVLDGRIILEWIFKKQGERAWIEFTWVRTGSSGGLL